MPEQNEILNSNHDEDMEYEDFDGHWWQYELERAADGTIVLMDTDTGEMITRGQQKALIEIMRNTIRVRELEEGRRLAGWLEWLIPEKRSDIFGSGPSLYLLESTHRPGSIKVGATVSMTKMTKIEERRLGLMPRVLAFAKTPNAHFIAKAVRADLKPHLKYRDHWYDAAVVREMVNEGALEANLHIRANENED